MNHFRLSLKKISVLVAVIMISITGLFTITAASQQVYPTLHKTVKVEGLDIFYREAGPEGAPTILLLHGFPTSSHMFRNLIPALADKYHVVAPDYPGYGNSSMPKVDEFEYTFDHMAEIIEKFVGKLGLKKYSLYLMDYGAPIGFRLAVAHPERVEALIIQNGNAYDEGIDNNFWEPIKAYWKNRKAYDEGLDNDWWKNIKAAYKKETMSNEDALRFLLTIGATQWQYTNGARNKEVISPENWHVDQRLLDRPGNQEIQLQMFYDYGSNPPLYPKWQAYFRKYQPPTLIVWGANDEIFPAAGAHPYKRDLKNLEFHLLDTGHFALEEDSDIIADYMRQFLSARIVSTAQPESSREILVKSKAGAEDAQVKAMQSEKGLQQIKTRSLALNMGAKTEERNTANMVSLNPEDANSYRSFAPELEKTIARMPQLDPETRLYVEEVKPNLFYVTGGVYQSAFLKTGAGVIVFDAPPSFAHKLPKVIKQHAPNEAIKYLVYSHGHADHVGGASAFSDIQDLQVVAQLKAAESIKEKNNPDILPPTITFQDQYDFSLGGEKVELKSASFHSEDADVLIYLPKQKFIMAVDTITPGEAPFMGFGATADIGAYLKFFDEVLEYDFDNILSGHVSILGNRADVVEAKEYALDVRASVLSGMQTFLERFDKTFAAFGYENANLAYRSAIEQVRGECSAEIIGKWKDRLSVVDVWADSHCEKMILYYIMH